MEGVLHAGVIDGLAAARGEGIAVWYAINPDLTLRAVEYASGASVIHAELERKGLLDHRYGERDVAAAQPVKRWQQTRFIDMAAVIVSLL